MATTPLMSLVLPTPGVGGTPGPTWASDLNTAFEIIDSHDHSSGSGSKVKTSGLSLDADLDFGNFDPKNVRALWLNNNTASLAGSLTNRLYAAAGELFFNDNAGNVIQMTSSGAINVASLGTITGDYSTSTADLTYSNTTKTYTFLQAAGITGDINCGAISLNENAAGVNAVKIKSPNSLGANYTITLPTGVPGSTLPVSMSATGVLSSAQILTAQIADANVTTAKIADANVTTAKIADANVTTAKIADANVTTVKIADGNILNAKLAASCVTSDKIAGGAVDTSELANNAVTRGKLAAVGQQVSAVDGGVTTSTSFNSTGIENLTVTITTTGRPVMVILQGDGSVDSYIFAGGGDVRVRIVRDSGASPTITSQYLGSGTNHAAPCNIVAIDPVAAGTYTYYVEYARFSGTNCLIAGAKLVAYEL